MVGKLSGRRYERALIFLGLIAVLLLVMVMPGIADAKHKAAEYVNGKGTYPISLAFSFNAKANDKDPLTDTATGKFKVTDTSGDTFFSGSISCLRTATAADGSHTANFVGEITKTNLTFPFGPFISFDATDSATGDMLTITSSASSVPCHDPTGGTTPVDKIVVHPLTA